MSEDKPVKDKDCIHCKKFFECNGKPRNALCVNYEERKDGRSKVDQDNNRHIQ